ncbi:MAG TPA: 2-oxoglutarate dehydrogenase E1 component, partial [Thioalkalivibrio sp.]|nr:2-oxoglutarate dehydrogenase E1 component [Thioalkalivibrio sp.]
VLPVLIHGDAAFAAQGVVMETLNMSQTRGFATKGTVHIVINNQIGFTTSTQKDARSTYYCTDVVKMVNAPIFHVNGDDPEAVAFVTRLALDFRMAFRKDVVIDLFCYRRHGHNEADEPAATQPMMYQRIRALPTTRALYAERLATDGVLAPEEAEGIQQQVRACLEAGDCMVAEWVPTEQAERGFLVDWSRYAGREWTEPANTAVTQQRIRELAERMLALPEGFEINPRVAKILDDRRKMAQGALPLDWGFAENMAYATLVTEGYAVRLSGQDSGRGTFFHRHAVLHNQKRYGTYVPLRNLAEDQAGFLVIDSLLSEEGVLGFEYGYATAAPDTLVIWEAQFGDFANGAQVVIDQFISSGEQKWGRRCGLTMLLPHGYEGQGPEHSSARLERYLQLCAQHNMQVCVPSTPAQVFHMLRRQMLRAYRKPLVVMSPKSLLRHKLAVNALEDLTAGGFQTVIDEIDGLDPRGIERVVLCSGKVYYDLLERRRELEREDIAIIRLEQLYPFPQDDLQAVLARYAKTDCYIWCQEEPLNQGAWYSTQHHIRNLLGPHHYLHHVTRPDSASPAVGYHGVHVEQQKHLVDEALGLIPASHECE